MKFRTPIFWYAEGSPQQECTLNLCAPFMHPTRHEHHTAERHTQRNRHNEMCTFEQCERSFVAATAPTLVKTSRTVLWHPQHFDDMKQIPKNSSSCHFCTSARTSDDQWLLIVPLSLKRYDVITAVQVCKRMCKGHLLQTCKHSTCCLLTKQWCDQHP